MKVVVQTAAMREALNLAGSTVAARTPKPVLQCVKFKAANNALTLLSTDLEVGCRYQVTAVQVEDDGEALAPAGRIDGIVRESGDDEALTLQTEKQTLHVRGGGTHFKVFGYDPGEYPQVSDFQGEGDLKVSADVLGGMIEKTLFATAKAHSHYAISGVLWQAEGKKLKLIATDGHRLALVNGSSAGSVKQNLNAIVPTKMMGLLSRLIGAGGGEETFEVKVQENQILVRTARAILVSSLVQGNFPKYQDVIPKQTSCKAEVNTAQFEHRLRQAALLTDEESRGVKFSFTPEQLTLSSRSPETGEAEVTCPIKYDGEAMDIAFNPAFLLDALRVAQADSVTLEMNASNKPALMRAGGDFQYVLMPVELG